MRSLRLCTYHVPARDLHKAGTSLRVAASPQKYLNSHSAKIAGSPSSNLFHDLFILEDIYEIT
jgi:hypothetical protein